MTRLGALLGKGTRRQNTETEPEAFQLTPPDLATPPRWPMPAEHWCLPTSRIKDIRNYYRAPMGKLVGMSWNNEPVYDPPSNSARHVLLYGEDSAGKDAFLGSWCWQALTAGRAVIVIDPHGLEWLPHTLAAAAGETGVTYRFVDLCADQPQINLAAEMNRNEFLMAMRAALELRYSNSDNDYWRNLRQAVKALSDDVDRWRAPCTIASWYQSVVGRGKESASGWRRRCFELARVAAINARGEDDPITEAMRNGGVVYIRGRAVSQPHQDAARAIARHVSDQVRQSSSRPAQLVVTHPSALHDLGEVKSTQHRLNLVVAARSVADFSGEPEYGHGVHRSDLLNRFSLRVAFRTPITEDSGWLTRHLYFEHDEDGAYRPYLPPGILSGLATGQAFVVGLPDAAPAVLAQFPEIPVDPVPSAVTPIVVREPVETIQPPAAFQSETALLINSAVVA